MRSLFKITFALLFLFGITQAREFSKYEKNAVEKYKLNEEGILKEMIAIWSVDLKGYWNFAVRYNFCKKPFRHTRFLHASPYRKEKTTHEIFTIKSFYEISDNEIGYVFSHEKGGSEMFTYDIKKKKLNFLIGPNDETLEMKREECKKE